MAQVRVRDVSKKAEANEAAIGVNRILIYVVASLTVIHICVSAFFQEILMVSFLVDVATLGAAIFVGSVAFDWWRKRNS